MRNLLLAGGAASSIVWLVVLIGLVIVMLIMPSITQKKRIQAYQEMQGRLKAGDKVQTIGGIVGKINKIKEKDGVKTVFIETGDKNNKMIIEFDINAIAGVVEGLPQTTVVASASQVETEETSQAEESGEEPTAVEPAEEEKPEKKATTKSKQTSKKK